ncbi:type II toxin-antitoxin system HicA family toxin [Geminocystis sp.]|uniref:type II toxin-antitoxin system HicA family toxin n=1 Tax=Geminocystis sp. TaxID=2664100 RepID=UPI0035942456
MGKYEKLIQKIIDSKSDENILFNDLFQLLKRLGFEERIRGSHHIISLEKTALQKNQIYKVM